MEITHVRTKTHTLYIGRGSIFGNPFVIGKDGNRDKVIDLYEKYARTNVRLLDAIRKIPSDAILGCYCWPKRCHGNVIMKLWLELNVN